nr:glycine--tRNA ligase subunit beta [Bacillus piscicola]
MANNDFLLEIGMEEMPARFVSSATEQLRNRMTEWLDENRIRYESVEAFSTPRRLAVRVKQMAERQEDITTEARGPSKKIARNENEEWSKAAIGFAKGQGVELADLYFKDQKGTEYLFAKKEVKGKATSELLPAVKELITGMNFPKNMRWGSYSLKYVRPIHWIIALLGDTVVPIEIAGVKSGRQSVGHRFLGEETVIHDPQEYEKALEKEYVIVQPEQRKSIIRSQIKALEEEKNWVIPIDENLLEEVNNLVEYPTVLSGGFAEEFLELPEEVLVTSMREHQRYFPVEDHHGKLLPFFVTVRNGNRDYIDNVQKGNEKVLRARLSDADFFFQEDQKLSPDEAAAKLDQVVFQEELGTIGDKTRRLQKLGISIASTLRVSEESLHQIERAAALCKFDLVTLMVDEFTELQGLMGEKYALLAGEKSETATAIKEHYQPRFADDEIPSSLTGSLLAITDKVDTIAACFGIGLIPTGSQDPYALRRQAAGIVQILWEYDYQLSLDDLVTAALDILETEELLKKERKTVHQEMISFFKARLKNLLMDRSIRYDIADSVLEDVKDTVGVMVKKAEFLQAKLKDSDFKDTVEALSRVTNIAKDETSEPVSVQLLEEQPEKDLHDAYESLSVHLPEQLENGNIDSAYRLLEEIKPAIHSYFDHVMVMTDDERIRKNRLAQMVHLSQEIRRFANFQYIVFSS